MFQGSLSGSLTGTADKMKPRFLSALQHNDAAEVDEILRTTNIDIDTVFDVEDRNRVLASYKQGNFCSVVSL